MVLFSFKRLPVRSWPIEEETFIESDMILAATDSKVL